MLHDAKCIREDALPDVAATEKLGATLAAVLKPGLVIHLEGDLGAGKTTLARALLRARGYTGPVKSPTYTLVEVYVVSRLYLYHFDFYRFLYPEEFEDAGLGEYFRDDAICLVEWPDKAVGYVPPADVRISLQHVVPGGRRCVLWACSEEGLQCLTSLCDARTLPPGG
ncbi:MAG: tRNA (adenosine(37)-N6)-threonylcarbamoyltransferase complex ATPase subunit type 1 TsaE [Zoogloeaceae bacterium]|jgi:tRNA threonylcarbamoyladenosine biosynthesis protein TsaE|nr:tRNA (adenosine(37)-N6)-threonylcarbamoyltransferase complex ATPase subunit type 1 TsaE [Zoogloeaceae bacterium]